MAMKNYAKSIGKNAAPTLMAVGAVIVADIAVDAAVSKVPYLQTMNPALINGGLLLAGIALGSNKSAALKALGLGLAIKGGVNLSDQYVRPAIDSALGQGPAVGNNYSMYALKGNVDHQMVAGGVDHQMVAGAGGLMG